MSMVENKLNSLSQAKEIKLNKLSGVPDMLTGMADADSLTTELLGATRSSPTNNERYDAVETVHGNSYAESKSDYSIERQAEQTARILGKDLYSVTQQDMIDVGNQQTIQKLADVARSPGEERWLAPLIKNSEAPNLTGKGYTDEFGTLVDGDGSIPLNVPINSLDTGRTDKWGKRKIASFVNPNTGANVTDDAYLDPNQNAFAPGTRGTNEFRGGITEMGAGERLDNTSRAIVATAVKPFVGLADVIVEQFGGDLGTDEEITESVNELFQYDTSFTEEMSAKVGSKIDHMNENGWTVGGFFDAVGDAVTTPELLGETVGFMVSMVVGGPTGAAGKAAQIFKAAKRIESIAKKAGNAKGIAAAANGVARAKKALKDVGSLKRGLAFASKNLGFTAQTVSMSSGDIEEYAKNAGISVEDVPLEKKLAIGGMNVLLNKVDFIIDKGLMFNPTVRNAILDLAVGATTKQLKTFGKGLAKLGSASTFGAAIEGGTEGLQEFMTQINQQVGEGTSKTIMDAWRDEENKKARLVSGVLGVAGAQQMSAVSSVTSSVAAKKAVDEAKVDVNREEAKASVRSSVEEKDFTYGGDVVEDADAEVLDGTLTFENIDNIKARSKDSNEFSDNLEAQKQHTLASVFTVNGKAQITGLSDEMKDLSLNDREGYKVRMNKVKDWMTSYGKQFTNEEGVITNKIIKSELDAFNSDKVEDMFVANTIDTSEILSDYSTTVAETLKAKGDLDSLDTAGKHQVIMKVMREGLTTEVTNEDGTVTRKLFDGLTEDSLNSMAKEATARYEISGFELTDGLTVSFDNKALAAQISVESGINKNSRIKAQKKGEASIDSTRVTSGILRNVLTSGLDAGMAENLGIDESDTKVKLRVKEKLDPIRKGMPGNVSKALTDAGNKVNKAISTFDKSALKGILKNDANVDDNLARLAVVAMNAINSATISDTELRHTVDGSKAHDSLLQKDEYYAGMTNVVTQIGKDYASSFDIQIEGDPKKVLKAYRDLGKAAIKLLSQDGIDLIEMTGEGDMLSVIGDNTFEDDNRKLAKGAQKFSFANGTDKITGKSKVLFKDTGIRLAGTSKLVDKNNIDEGERNLYENPTGDAIKRLSKLILPNHNKAPSKVASEGLIRKSKETVLNSNIEKRIVDFRNEEFRIKPEMLSMLNVIKDTVAKSDGNIYVALKENAWLKDLLGINESNATILKASEDGSNNSKIDAITGILDNLDDMADGTFHYEYQVDVNNRITLMETVMNFQHDKVFARQLVTGSKEFEISDPKAIDYLVNSVIEELGIAKTANEYKDAREALLNGGTSSKLKPIIALAKIMKSGMSEERKLKVLAESTQTKALGKFSGKAFTLRSLAQAVSDIQNRDESGTITTNYMVEMDASASGVFNTMINIMGRSPEVVKELLKKLGVSFKGEKVSKDQLEDAYNLLAITVDATLTGSESEQELLREAEEAGIRSKSSDLLVTIKSLKDLGIDTRELAKPPVMTWFYSAGQDTITKELTSSILQQVVQGVVDGDAKAVAHMQELIGDDTVTANEITTMKVGSSLHKKIIAKYNDIGTIYSESLDKAFPEVTNYKKDVATLFSALSANSTINGKDYWGGHIRSASAVLELGKQGKETRTMEDGRTTIYKQKNIVVDQTDKQSRESGLIDEEKFTPLLTTSESRPNQSSMLPGMAHNIDAAQLLEAVGELLGNTRTNTGVMTVHDAVYGNVNDLLDVQGSYEQSAITLAKEYDMLDNILLSMENVVSKIRVDIDNGTLTGKDAKEAKASAKNLETISSTFKIFNDSRIESKKKLLEGATVNMFGVQKADVAPDGEPVKRTEVKAKPKAVKKEIKVETTPDVKVESGTEEDFNTPFDTKSELDTFLDSKKDTKAVSELLSYLATKTARGKKALDESAEVTFASFDADAKKKFKSVGEGSFIDHATNTIYLRGNKDTRTGKKFDEESLLDVVSHEIEHAMTNAYIEEAAVSGNKVEYNVLKKVIEKMRKSKVVVDGRTSIAAKRLNYVLSMKDDKAAIKELVAIYQGEAGVRGEFVNAIAKKGGFAKSNVTKWLEAIRNAALKALSKLTNGKISYEEVVKNLPQGEADISMENIVEAVEILSSVARESDKQTKEIDISKFNDLIKDCKI